jgi:uncharacterized protein YraI
MNITLRIMFSVIIPMIVLALINHLFTVNKAHASWETTGNTVSTGQFIGSTNQQDFTLKTNNFDRLVFKSHVNGTATNMVFPTNLASFKLSAHPTFLQSNGTLTGLYGPGSFLNLTSDGASFDSGTNVNIKQGASLRFYDGANYSAFKASPNATNITWTLPATDGVGALTSDGNGNLSWVQQNYIIHTDGGTYTILSSDYTVETNATEILVPSATQSNKGKHYEIINTGDSNATLHTENGQPIGNLNPTEDYQLPAGGAVTLVSNGVGWRIVGVK